MSKKVSLYEKVCFINKACYINNLFFYHKGNIIQAFLEALLTVYLAEGCLAFTRFFLINPFNSQQMIKIISIPFFIACLVCFFYLIFVVYFFTSNIYDYSKNIKEDLTSDEAKQEYINIEKGFQRVCIKDILLGCSCYIFIATVSAWIFIFITKDNLISPEKLRLFLILFGGSFGAGWNALGYLRDKRINWSAIIKNFNYTKLEGKFRYLICHFIWQAIMILVIIVCFFFIILFLHPSISERVDDIYTYYLFIALFITALSFYIRNIFTYYYERRDDNAHKIYIQLEDFGDVGTNTR